MRRRVFTVTFALSFCLLAARAASADTIVFQNAVASGNGQSGPAQTSPGVSGSTAQQVQTVDFGDVTGTVCDCGEIEPAGAGATGAGPSKGGFPKFPLLAAAAAPIIPCFFGICTNNPPQPTPTPPTSSTPEPMTITTFVAGLTALAGLRLRRRRRA
jgi:MYXO-CTERM domain-containing protein